MKFLLFNPGFLTFLISLILLSNCQVPPPEKATKEKQLVWNFPLKRTHAGILLANGKQGLMVWGWNNQLNITIGRAGFWDHRGGNDFSARTKFTEVKKMLYENNEKGLRNAFAAPEKKINHPPRPYQIGGGRMEIRMPEEWFLYQGVLVLERGEIRVILKNSEGIQKSIRIRQAIYEETAWVEFPEEIKQEVSVQLIPSWDHVGAELSRYDVAPPETWNEMEEGGFIQRLPEDDPLAIRYRKTDNLLIFTSALGQDVLESSEKTISGFNQTRLESAADEWWKNYWDTAPSVNLPDPELQEIVDYGLYKLACVTPGHGLPCSLQGPFNEEYQLPPWSNDYHFNINIEMIYWPVFASGKLDHLDPLWDMLNGWMPELMKNGESFFGREGAIMLPHAVDDRCQVVGTFWTGTIDHACTAWIAQMAWMHYRYSLDTFRLKDLAWPLMKGTFEGYWAMLEEIKDPDGQTRLSLPVSVSPEFKGSRMDAWGRDASFQLAALRMTAQNLIRAAAILDEPLDPRWEEVLSKLPEYTVISSPATLENPERKVERIALWEGMDLIESHRHHSYLSGIWPFMTYDPLDSLHQEIIGNTISNWVLKGPGLWSGWCVPWASVIHSRLNQPRAAIEWLHWWKSNFTNEGRGTLHDAAFSGTSLIASPDYTTLPPGEQHREVMQLDAGFGALTAVYEMLVQDRMGVIHVLPAMPTDWKSLSFKNILTEGAFLISCDIQDGKRKKIIVESLKGGTIRLAHGFPGNWKTGNKINTDPIVLLKMDKGQRVELEEAAD